MQSIILEIREDEADVVIEDGRFGKLERKTFNELLKDRQYLDVSLSAIHITGKDHGERAKNLDLTPKIWKQLLVALGKTT